MDVTQKSETQIFTTEFSELSVIEDSVPLIVNDPVIDQGPYSLINRKRKINDFTHVVPDPSTPGYTLDMRPYTALLSRIDAGLLDKFEMFKANVRITVNVTCPATTFGFALVAWYWGNSAFTPTDPISFDTVLQTSSMDHYLLPISTSASVEFVIPYKHVYPYYRLVKTENGTIDIAEAGIEPKVRILTLITGNNTSEPASVSYDIYAAFEETHVARLGAPLVESVVLNSMVVKNQNKRAQESNALVNTATAIASSLVPANVAAVGNAIVNLKSAYDYYSPSMYKMIQTVRDTRDSIMKTTSMLSEGKSNPRTQEAYPEPAKQLTMEESPPSLPIATAEERGDHTGVKQSYFGDIARTTVNSNCNILDVTSPCIPLGIDSQPHRDYSLQELVSIPTIYTIITYTSSTAKGTTWEIPISPMMADPFTITPYSYGAFYSSFFRFMKTDVRLTFHVACSPLVSSRLEAKVNYRETGTTSYEAITSVHYVSGASTFTVDVPYVYWKNVCRRNTRLGTVSIVLQVPPTNTTTDPSLVYVVVYSSLQNTSFYSPQSWVSPKPPPIQEGKVVEEEVKLNMYVRDLHSHSASSNIVQKSRVPYHLNEVKSLRTLLARFDTFNDADATNKITRTSTLPLDTYSLPICAISPFAFYSGSRELKLYDGGETPTKILSYWIENSNNPVRNSVAQGTAATDTRVWNFLDVIVPWLVDASCLYTHANDGYDAQNIQFTNFVEDGSALEGLYRFGPDFGVSIVNFLPHPNIW